MNLPNSFRSGPDERGHFGTFGGRFVAETLMPLILDLEKAYADDGGTVRGRDAVLLRDGEEVARVLDLPWQGVDPEHWRNAAAAGGRVMLAGGLGPENVREAIEAVQPWAVDASSSLESEPGIKDHDRVRAYVEAARG